jgi:hypothetical protein
MFQIQCFLLFGNVTVTVAPISVQTKLLNDDDYDKKRIGDHFREDANGRNGHGHVSK